VSPSTVALAALIAPMVFEATFSNGLTIFDLLLSDAWFHGICNCRADTLPRDHARH
jgi:hypothetical protein